MAASIKIVLSGISAPRGTTQASFASQTVVFRNTEPGRHPEFTDFTIQRGETVTMRISRQHRANETDY